MTDAEYARLVNADVKVTLKSGNQRFGILWSLTKTTVWLVEEGVDVFVNLVDVQFIELAGKESSFDG